MEVAIEPIPVSVLRGPRQTPRSPAVEVPLDAGIPMLAQRFVPAEVFDEIPQLSPIAEAREDEASAPLLLLGKPEKRQTDGQGNLPHLDVHRTADHLLVRD